MFKFLGPGHQDMESTLQGGLADFLARNVLKHCVGGCPCRALCPTKQWHVSQTNALRWLKAVVQCQSAPSSFGTNKRPHVFVHIFWKKRWYSMCLCIMHMYMCTCMCICMYNIYIYSIFHWDRMPAAYKWLSVRQLSQSILVMLLHSVQIVLDRSRISVWVLFSTLVLLTVAIESRTYITGCQLHTKFQSECHLAWTWSLIAVEDPSMELMHTSPGLKENNFKNCIHTTDYNTTMNQCLWLSWRTCWTAVE
jgi:hypothetical protein